MQRLQENLPEPGDGQPIGNANLNDAGIAHYDELIKVKHEKKDEPTYVLTLEEDPSWTHGNPTGISTRIAADTTETYLFFTRTTFIWNADGAVFFTNSNTPITTLPVATVHTTITVTGDEPTATAGISEITATTPLSTILDNFSTEIVSSTTSVSSTAATSTDSAIPDKSSDLPQGAVIGICVGLSVLFLGVGILAWTICQKRRDNAKAEAALPRARTWEPMDQAHHHASPPTEPVRYAVPDMPAPIRRDIDYDYGHDHPIRAYHQAVQQQAQQQAQQAQQQSMTPQSMTPPPASPYHQQGQQQQPMGPYQAPVQQQMPQQAPQMPQQGHQAQQPVYTAYHPSMGAANPQNFAVELPSENYRN